MRHNQIPKPGPYENPGSSPPVFAKISISEIRGRTKPAAAMTIRSIGVTCLIAWPIVARRPTMTETATPHTVASHQYSCHAPALELALYPPREMLAESQPKKLKINSTTPEPIRIQSPVPTFDASNEGVAGALGDGVAGAP